MNENYKLVEKKYRFIKPNKMTKFIQPEFIQNEKSNKISELLKNPNVKLFRKIKGF
jgi:hypothetical protein